MLACARWLLLHEIHSSKQTSYKRHDTKKNGPDYQPTTLLDPNGTFTHHRQIPTSLGSATFPKVVVVDLIRPQEDGLPLHVYPEPPNFRNVLRLTLSVPGTPYGAYPGWAVKNNSFKFIHRRALYIFPRPGISPLRTTIGVTFVCDPIFPVWHPQHLLVLR
ncbi:unnamed protein product [Ectocarpus sp. 8 AP-2014]